jgi:hypothetical protein
VRSIDSISLVLFDVLGLGENELERLVEVLERGHDGQSADAAFEQRVALLHLSFVPPPALGERRHRGLARRRVAVRGACNFSWISRLAKDQQQQPQALANAIMARPPARPCCQSPTCQSPSAIKLLPLRIGYYPAREDVVRRQLCCGLTVD